MSDVMRYRFAVTVDVDPDVWADVYGLAPAKVRADIDESLRGVIAESINGWLVRTGNSGIATVAP